MQLLSLTNDAVFKLFFASPKNTDLLIHFLQAVLNLTDPIEEVTILNPDLPKETVDDKGLVVDLIVLTQSGDRLHVEMQAREHRFFKERISYYNSTTHTSQLLKGAGYDQIKKTISVVITNFTLIKDEPDYHNDFMFRNQKGVALTDTQQIHTLELTKLSDDLTSEKALWLKLFTTQEVAEVEQLSQASPILNQAVGRLKALSADDEVRELARVRENALRLSVTIESVARAEGIQEGIEQGIE